MWKYQSVFDGTTIDNIEDAYMLIPISENDTTFAVQSYELILLELLALLLLAIHSCQQYQESNSMPHRKSFLQNSLGSGWVTHIRFTLMFRLLL